MLMPTITQKWKGYPKAASVKQGRTTGAMPPLPHSILDKNKDLGNYDKYLPLRDCFLAGLLQ